MTILLIYGKPHVTRIPRMRNISYGFLKICLNIKIRTSLYSVFNYYKSNKVLKPFNQE